MSTQYVVITVATPEPKTGIVDQLVNQGGAKQLLARWFGGIADGSWQLGPLTSTSAILENIGAVYATGTITITSTGPTNTETLTIAGVTVTAVSGTPSGLQVKTNASATTVATELTALINSNSAFAGIVTATSAAGVVTVSSAVPGAIGNGLVQANVNWANTTVVTFASGLDGTLSTIAQ